MGIALATAISAWVNAILLFIILIIRKTLNLDRKFVSNIFKLFICLIGLIFIIRYLENLFLKSQTVPESKSYKIEVNKIKS